MYQSQAFRKDFEFYEFTCFFDFFFKKKYVITNTMQRNHKFSGLFQN